MTRAAPRVEPAPPGRTAARPGDWTEERVAELRRLWEGGANSASAIAEILAVSRNSVLSKVHRLGLTQGSVSARPARKPRGLAEDHGRTSADEIAIFQPSGSAPVDSLPVPWRDKGYRTKPPSRGWASGAGLTDWSPFSTCQYLRGEAKARDFCGAAVLERPDGRRSSYCAEHHALCWTHHQPSTRPRPRSAGHL